MNPPILSMRQVPCNCIEPHDAKCSATHVHPSAAIKRIGQLSPCHRHLVRPPFPPVSITLHIAVLKTPLTPQNLLLSSLDSSTFAGHRNQTRATFNFRTCANSSSLSMRESDTRSGSRRAGDRVGIGYDYFRLLFCMFLLFFRSSFPALLCYSTFYLNPSRIALVTFAFDVAPTIVLSNPYSPSSITSPSFSCLRRRAPCRQEDPSSLSLFSLLFPPFTLTIARSLACSLVPLNRIKALAV